MNKPFRKIPLLVPVLLCAGLQAPVQGQNLMAYNDFVTNKSHLKDATPAASRAVPRRSRLNSEVAELKPIKAAAITVTGRVTDSNGEALPGVTVALQGTTVGAFTDVEGNYTLAVPDDQENGTLIFSFIGYVTQAIQINNRTVINVTLDEDVKALEEVVIIGYQTVRKTDLTGAVSVVDANDAQRVTANTVAESLQGLAAGVTVRNTGAPGATASIDIRGTGTFGANQPLYVIDGMLSNATPDFNPNDIESIQVLKDASAAAIYGSRAANGVIIITTKRGKEGPLQITGSVKTGIQQFPKRWDLMNSSEFAALNRQAYINSGLTPQTSVSTEYDPNVDIDWQDALMRTGSTQDYNLSLSGGSATGNYLVSGNYFRNKGTIIDNSFERASFRVNTTGERGRFSFGEFFLFSYTHDDYLEGNPLVEMLRMLPTMPIQSSRYVGPSNPEGWAVGDPTFANTFGTNPVALQRLSQRDQYSYRIRGNAFVAFEILENLSYKFNAGLETNFDNFKGFRRPGVVRQGTPNVLATSDENRAQFISSLFEHTLNFERQIGDHNISAVAGISNQIFRYEQLYGQKQNLPLNTGTGEYYTVLNQGDNPTVGSYINKWAILGYLGRVNYNYKDRYLVSASFRRDADSRFGPEYRWGNFPSASVAWRISEEDFFGATWVNDLKLRASYGALGNSEVLSPWQYFGRISPFPRAVFGADQTIQSGATNIQLANPDLHWEEKKTTNFGVDAGFLNNRLTVTAEYFISKTEDVLTNLPVPLTTGNAAPSGTTSAPPVNAASLQNTGIELSATLRSVENPFKWDLNLNLTHIKNEVLELGNLGAGRSYIQSGDARTEVGRAIGEWYVLETDGIFQSQAEVDAHGIQPWAQPGDIRYVDVNGDGVLDVDEDRTYVGSPWPKIQGGLIWNASYKNFSFSMQWYGVAGNKIYNRPRYWTDRMDENASYRSDLSPWTPENTDTDDPRIGIANDDQGIQFNARPDTDRWLEDGSYLRLRNLEIGYNLPENLLERVGLRSARVSLSGQNLFTFTKYTGLDPDVTGTNIFERGLDNGQYPSLRIYSIGAQFGF
ncbi:SusC/RagA family TonB-linked outer membrane protein [Pontibacter silvestris]|uniref:SusC/RagA family TonB-linked outer membrane protein n=1 Tax=Pontibacter silvestris TaxID=2305183 RepID=A0ABW4WXS8_9BACT|nr:TonB-dependent receptor [Pontibacter silvestris]MCC9135359.1 TonB-dependent receptor [Pontibacter silvestris]